MSVEVLVGDEQIAKYNNQLKSYKFSMDIRKTLGGDFVIYDHHDIDIVIMPQAKKIVAFPKDDISELTYDTSARLFDYLSKKGVVARDSIQGGTVYASLQGALEQAGEGVDALQVAIFALAKFIEAEKPRYEYMQRMEEEEEEYMTQPNDDNSTELGEVPHQREKGTIRPGIYYQAYMHNRFYRR